MSRVTSIRLSDDLIERLDKLAESLDRPRAWLIEQALSRYLDEQSWQVEAITDALAEYRGGRAKLRSQDAVMTTIETKLRVATGDADPLA